MGDRRFAEPKQRGDVADAQLGARKRVEDADPGGIAKDLERLRQRDDGRLGEKGALEPRRPPERGRSDGHRPSVKV